MRWFMCTMSVYYGGNTGTRSASNVVVGPVLYNSKLYGTEVNLMHQTYFYGALLQQDYLIYPVDGAAITYHYQRIVGSPTDRDLSSSWGMELPNTTISGKYRFYTNVSGSIYGGFSIPCTFVINKSDGSQFVGNCIRGYSYSDRFATDKYKGLAWGNVIDESYVSFGGNSDDVSIYSIPSSYKDCVIDFGTAPQNIPLFIKEWIETNADVVIEEESDNILYSIKETTLRGVADAIRAKTGKTAIIPVPKMKDEIASIVTEPELYEETFVENGSYTPEGNYDGFSKVNVEVPVPDKYGGSFEIEGEESDGGIIVLQEKAIDPTTELQEVTPDSDYDGLGKVIVNAIPEEYIVPTGDLLINKNGSHDVTAYASVTVNVSDDYLGSSGAIDLQNIPSVYSIDNPSDDSATIVEYQNELYILIKE